MNLPDYFVDRPIFATVLSALIVIVGAMCLFQLPVNEYPEVAPPTITVRAVYPGASPQVIAETVASPLEQQLTGIEGTLYTSSISSADGSMSLTLTFRLGTDLQDALVEVQNRIQQATPRLPEDVRRLGIVAKKSSADLTLVVSLVSPDGRYDDLYLANYGRLHIADALARLPGMGEVIVFGAGEYALRVWLDPDRLASLGLTVGEVVSAIREQNLQVAAGSLGAQPNASPVPTQLTVTAQGRLLSEEQFGGIVVRASPEGRLVRLRDVARIDLGAASYGIRSFISNQAAANVVAFQASGSNAISVSNAVRDRMKVLAEDFPEGLEYRIVYDPTVFVRGSINAVVHTLIEAIILVVIVVVVFLQTWRASIIPLCAVPVSLIGTFAVMSAFGFSINSISMFGLVLAIGIVVDDAIVVVENVERNIALGLSPRDATRQAMKEVVGPIIATALVLCAVFVPTAFISGLTGQFYKQFAITIAISTVISAFNSLTLSPALAAYLLKPHGAKRDRLTRILDVLLGWFFRPFNRFFAWASDGYVRAVRGILRFSLIAGLLYLGFNALTVAGFKTTPTGYIPAQDKQYVIAFAMLPDGSSLDRTVDVMKRMSDMATSIPGVLATVAIPGLGDGFAATSSQGLMFVPLKPFEERDDPSMGADAILGQLQAKFSGIREALVFALPAAPVRGLGFSGGFKVQVQDTGGVGLQQLEAAVQHVLAKARQTLGLDPHGTRTSFSMTVPQIELTFDRERMKQQGIAFTDVSAALGTYLGSAYANDFNRFGRTYQVNVQADAPFRVGPEDITRLRVRNARGDMVPMSTLVAVRETAGPGRVTHYNNFPSADINSAAGAGFSSDQAQALMSGLLERELPKGLSYDWTELVFQQQLAGNTSVYIFPLCVLLVFMVLAALYESWSLPLVVILIVPMCLLCAIAGVVITGGTNDIFTQIGFIVLVGLACKNAILIVEFARDEEKKGVSRARAALTACRLRLRPILMTSLAFIMGVWPLVTSHGAGAETRHALGVAVFSGMIGVTIFGLALTPVFYVAIRRWAGRGASTIPAQSAEPRLPH
ncbi:MAG: efflux RND transporter permease subunit [Planctomycetes bacterium]|nr:efflux RND transporter permease subunit [Planctomycetota bacterium]